MDAAGFAHELGISHVKHMRSDFAGQGMPACLCIFVAGRIARIRDNAQPDIQPRYRAGS